MPFKRFTIDDINANKFYQMPKFLFREDLELNNDARVLYSLLRDRHELSVINKWVNSKGEVYLIYTRDEMCKTLKVSLPTLRKTINMLKTANLIFEERQGCNKPNLIFLNYISDLPTATKLNKEHIEEEKLSNTDNENSTKKVLESHIDTGLKEFYTPKKTQKNRTERILHSEQKEFCTPECKDFSLNKTNISNTKINKSIGQSNDDGQTDKIRTQLKEQIEYEYFSETYPENLLGINAIIDCMVQLIMNPITKINGISQSREALLPYIKQVDSSTVREFIEYIKTKNLKDVKNKTAYLSSAFINYLREESLLKLQI